jgi:molybdopterin-guanine dinucleotide biosynthesis protein A
MNIGLKTTVFHTLMGDTIKKIAGVILAGGLAKRMNGVDKGLQLYRNRPLVSFAIEALEDLTGDIIINANRSLDAYRKFKLPVLSDKTENFQGPLAGILTAIEHTDADYLLVMPCDCPLIKTEHMKKLLNTLLESSADIAVAFDGERLHPVFLALNTTVKSGLQTYLDTGQRKIENWIRHQNMILADFSDQPRIFFNINSWTQLSELEAVANAIDVHGIS